MRAFLKSSETFLASHAVVFRGVVLSSSPQAGVSGEEDNTTPPKKTTAWEAKTFRVDFECSFFASLFHSLVLDQQPCHLF